MDILFLKRSAVPSAGRTFRPARFASPGNSSEYEIVAAEKIQQFEQLQAERQLVSDEQRARQEDALKARLKQLKSLRTQLPCLGDKEEPKSLISLREKQGLLISQIATTTGDPRLPLLKEVIACTKDLHVENLKYHKTTIDSIQNKWVAAHLITSFPRLTLPQPSEDLGAALQAPIASTDTGLVAQFNKLNKLIVAFSNEYIGHFNDLASRFNDAVEVECAVDKRIEAQKAIHDQKSYTTAKEGFLAQKEALQKLAPGRSLTAGITLGYTLKPAERIALTVDNFETMAQTHSISDSEKVRLFDLISKPQLELWTVEAGQAIQLQAQRVRLEEQRGLLQMMGKPLTATFTLNVTQKGKAEAIACTLDNFFEQAREHKFSIGDQLTLFTQIVTGLLEAWKAEAGIATPSPVVSLASLQPVTDTVTAPQPEPTPTPAPVQPARAAVAGALIQQTKSKTCDIL